MAQPQTRIRQPVFDAVWRTKYGPWALVTGASDGIGREIARTLAANGLNLVLVARRHPVLETLANDLRREHAIDIQVIAADLSQIAEVERVQAETAGLDVGLVVMSAGFGTSSALADSNLENELNMVDVNCRAVLMMSHHYGQRLAQQRRGGMILLSSILAFQGVPMVANYAATKAYVQSLAEGLHRELALHGVDVLASAPGPTRSGFTERASMHFDVMLSAETVAHDTLNTLGRKITVRPGWLSVMLESALTTLPRAARTRVMGAIVKASIQGARAH